MVLPKSIIAVAALIPIALPLFAIPNSAGSKPSDERTLETVGYFAKTPNNKVERLDAALKAGKSPLTYDPTSAICHHCYVRLA